MTTFRITLLAAALAAVPLLTACAEGESLSDRVAGASRVKGDDGSVEIFQASSAADALPLAMGHCAHFGRSAQYQSHDGTTFRFRCVPG